MNTINNLAYGFTKSLGFVSAGVLGAGVYSHWLAGQTGTMEKCGEFARQFHNIPSVEGGFNAFAQAYLINSEHCRNGYTLLNATTLEDFGGYGVLAAGGLALCLFLSRQYQNYTAKHKDLPIEQTETPSSEDSAVSAEAPKEETLEVEIDIPIEAPTESKEEVEQPKHSPVFIQLRQNVELLAGKGVKNWLKTSLHFGRDAALCTLRAVSYFFKACLSVPLLYINTGYFKQNAQELVRNLRGVMVCAVGALYPPLGEKVFNLVKEAI